MPDLYPDKKRCKDCGELKLAGEFWRRKQSPDGLSLYCRECFGVRNAAAYRKKQAAIGKEARAYRRHSAVPDGMKYCARCAEIKPFEDFGRNRADPSGRTTYCKPCHNEAMAAIKAKKHGSVRGYHFQRRYGMTEAEVEGAAAPGRFLSHLPASACAARRSRPCLRRRPGAALLPLQRRAGPVQGRSPGHATRGRLP
jgi:hypothetical protein